MEDLNYYLKELRLLKDSPNLEQLLLKMENEPEFSIRPEGDF